MLLTMLSFENLTSFKLHSFAYSCLQNASWQAAVSAVPKVKFNMFSWFIFFSHKYIHAASGNVQPVAIKLGIHMQKGLKGHLEN